MARLRGEKKVRKGREIVGAVSERRVRGEGKTWGCNWWLGSVEMIERGENEKEIMGKGLL